MEPRFRQNKIRYYSEYEQNYIKRIDERSNREAIRIAKRNTLRNFKCVCNLGRILHNHEGCVENLVPSLWYLAAEKYSNSIPNHEPLDLMVSMRLYGIHIAIVNFLLKHHLWGKLFEYKKVMSNYRIRTNSSLSSKKEDIT